MWMKIPVYGHTTDETKRERALIIHPSTETPTPTGTLPLEAVKGILYYSIYSLGLILQQEYK